MAAFTDGGGVDGHDCLDKTANSRWGETFAPITFSSGMLMEALNDLSSFTVCGWWKTKAGKDIGGDATLISRPGQFEVYTPGGAAAGVLGLKSRPRRQQRRDAHHRQLGPE